jgi:FtsP/CotA-like multicopper oxidase with cupredoxin domain
MNATSTSATFVQAAETLAAHVADYQLPEMAFLGVMTSGGRSEARAQVQPHTLAGIAAELVIWAQTLNTLAIQVWRVPEGDRVQLSIASTLTGPAGEVGLTVYGGCPHDPALVIDLAPGDKRNVTLQQLRVWAVGGGVA